MLEEQARAEAYALREDERCKAIPVIDKKLTARETVAGELERAIVRDVCFTPDSGHWLTHYERCHSFVICRAEPSTHPQYGHGMPSARKLGCEGIETMDEVSPRKRPQRIPSRWS